MAIIESKAFEAEHGLEVRDPASVLRGPFITGGQVPPLGLNLTQNTLYLQNSNGRVQLWQKFGVNPTDWRLYSAVDNSFVPMGENSFTGLEETVDDALRTLGSQTFADATNFDDFEELPNQNTTSNGWVQFARFTTRNDDDTADEARPTGRFVAFVAGQLGQSDKEKKVGFRLQTRTGTSGGWTTREPLNFEDTVGSDNTYKLISGFAFFEHTDGNEPYQIRIQFGQTDDGGTGRLRNVKVLTYKVNEL